jgi:hypothetical protein
LSIIFVAVGNQSRHTHFTIIDISCDYLYAMSDSGIQTPSVDKHVHLNSSYGKKLLGDFLFSPDFLNLNHGTQITLGFLLLLTLTNGIQDLLGRMFAPSEMLFEPSRNRPKDPLTHSFATSTLSS